MSVGKVEVTLPVVERDVVFPGAQVIADSITDGRIRRLTSGQSNNEEPSWSPDGRHIAFTSDRGGTKQIFIMNADGARQRAVTSTGMVDANTKKGDMVSRTEKKENDKKAFYSNYLNPNVDFRPLVFTHTGAPSKNTLEALSLFPPTIWGKISA